VQFRDDAFPYLRISPGLRRVRCIEYKASRTEFLVMASRAVFIQEAAGGVCVQWRDGRYFAAGEEREDQCVRRPRASR
jgi:hypothetical protein